MALAIIEINDTGLQLAVDEEKITTSAGYAVLDGDKLLIGQEGFANARLLPRWTNNRFWNQLGTEPIANGTTSIRHNADLAFAHLESLWTELGQKVAKDVEQAIFIVPGYLSREQLSLLLGMSKECSIPLASLVDTSLISVCNHPLSETVLHLDASLHRFTLTRLNANMQLSREESTTILDSGISSLWDRWASVIANQFIQTIRYDPLHEAVSEQKLYDRIPQWIASLDAGRSHQFDLELADVSQSITLSTDQLIEVCSSIYPQLVQGIRSLAPEGQQVNLFLSHRLKGFPGLEDSLRLIKNISIHNLGETDSLQATFQYREGLLGKGSGISHILKLPISFDSTKTPANTGPMGETNPTHMLFENQAYAIGKVYKLSQDLKQGPRESEDPACTLYIQGRNLLADNHLPGKVLINGNQAEKTNRIRIGDVVRIADAEIRFISVKG